MVHVVLVDPVPEARATAAKALGTLVERLGEVNFPDLVPGLLRTLKTDTSGVDRQGAAQGLSEVLAGLGMERMEGLLPDVITNAQSPRSTVREGFMSLLVFLPATFGARFQPHLPKIIPPILNGLSDSEDYVREAAMRAGRMIVTNYSNKAIDLLLPELERGMFDAGWRIRVCFLLFMLYHYSNRQLAIFHHAGWRTSVQGVRNQREGRDRGGRRGGRHRACGVVPKGARRGSGCRASRPHSCRPLLGSPGFRQCRSPVVCAHMEGVGAQYTKDW